MAQDRLLASWRPLLFRSLVVMVLVAGASLPPAAHGRDAPLVCLSNLEQIALVERGEIIPLSAVINMRKVQKKGRVVRTKLCKKGKKYIYVITLMTDSAKISKLTVRATPKPSKIKLRLAKSCYYQGQKWRIGSICKHQCFGDSCPRQYCKSNGEWTPLPPCGRYVSCLAYSDCASP
jgi:hypothetical protein